MKLPPLARKLFGKRLVESTSQILTKHQQNKTTWSCRLQKASNAGLTLGYLDGFDSRGRLIGWFDTHQGAGHQLSFGAGDQRTLARAEIQRQDVLAAGYAGGRGFEVDVLALAPLAEALLDGSPLRVLDAQGELLCEPLEWTSLPADNRSTILFAWLTECFKAALEGNADTRRGAIDSCFRLARQPEVDEAIRTQPTKLGAALKAMQDICAENFGADTGFAENLRTLRDLCLQLCQKNPRWENAAAGFEIALKAEEFLRLLRREWRQKSRLKTNLLAESLLGKRQKKSEPGMFLAPPLYPDRLHYLPWDGWVRKALENGLVLATNLARSEPLSTELIAVATDLCATAALLYRDEEIIASAQRLTRLCGVREPHAIEVEARALKKSARFTEAYALEKAYGIDAADTPEAKLACFTTILGVALEIHQPLSYADVQAWRARLASHASEAAGDELLQRTLANYIAFCGRLISHPQALGALSLKKVLRVRRELIGSVRELLHLASPHRVDAYGPAAKPRGTRIVVVGSDDLPQVRLYRQIQKIEALRSLQASFEGLEVAHVDTWQQIDSPKLTQLLTGTVLLVICRIPATLPFLRLVHAARGAGIHILYDIDDLLFDSEHFPPPYATYAGGISRRDHRRLAEDTALWLEAMNSADTLIVSTNTLARRAGELLDESKPILIEPNHAPALLLEQAQVAGMGVWTGGTEVHLVYGTGTRAHKQILHEWIFPAFLQLLDLYPRLRISLVGMLEDVPDALASHAHVNVIPFGSYTDYLAILATADLSLAPLEHGIATDAKSALKWMEAAMLGAACVVSPTATYKEILESELDVLFADSASEWQAQLGRLIERDPLRKRIAKAANGKARRLSNASHAMDFWRNRLNEIPALNRVVEKPQPRRLLVVNLYFWPQAAGGATRVVEDQVRGLQSRYSGQYEITVLCADKFAGDLGVDFSFWGENVRVVRLHAAGKSWAAWLDQDVEEFMRSWLRAESFDLVHIHAIQVLTASLLKPVREAEVPYFVTLHDAWWVCEHQFLTRSYGEPVDAAKWTSDLEIPGTVINLGSARTDASLVAELEDCLNALYENAKAMEALHRAGPVTKRLIPNRGPTVETLMEDRRKWDERLENLVEAQSTRVQVYSNFVRRRELEECLAAAAAVFAVSQRFADLYTSALADSVITPPPIEVLQNDWRPSPPSAAHRPEQPLKIAFIGGWSVHKGAAVVREAASRLKNRNLEFTIVDYALGREELRRVDWNGIQVSFIGPRGLSEMAAFYHSVDVLLAPSIWPESFGLVSREALSAGVWVIASDVGALAEPVEEGVNGAVIPPRDAQALADAIEFAASPGGVAARAGWRAQAITWQRELPQNDILATLHLRYGESVVIR